jgi:hypothetical protein
MTDMLHMKLLLIVIVLLGAITSYLAYQHHTELTREKQAQEFRRPMRQDEKDAQPTGWADALKKR